MKTYTYLRKSSESEDRQMLSLDSQLKENQKLAQRNGYKIDAVYQESKSAKAPGRKVFNEMLETIRNEDGCRLVVWHADRLARNMIDGGQLLYLMDQGKVVEICTRDAMYRNTPDDKFMMAMSFSVAKKYVDDLSKNVKRGLQDKLDAGWRPSTAPHGYLNTKFAERGSNYIVIDEDYFPLIRKAWDMMLSGCFVLTDVLDSMNNEWGFRTRKTKRTGGKPLTKGGLHRILTNPFYAGFIEYSGTYKKGEHHPMVTLAEFDRVQVILGRYGKPRPNRYEYAYAGQITCGQCGGYVSATFKEKKIKKTGEVKTYTLYYCTNARRTKRPCDQRTYTNVEAIETRIEAELASISIAPQFLDLAFDVIEKKAKEDAHKGESVQESRLKAQASVSKKLKELTHMRMNELLDDEEFRIEKAALTKEQYELAKAVEADKEQSKNWVELTRETFRFATYAHANFLAGDAKTRREMLLGLAGLNCTLIDQTFNVQALDWFRPLQEADKTLKADFESFEPKLAHTSWTKNRIEEFRPVMRGRRDLNSQPPA